MARILPSQIVSAIDDLFGPGANEIDAAPEQLQALLRPFPVERMEAHEIGPEIGNVRNDSAGLIERLRSA
jgi:hypothetical protein